MKTKKLCYAALLLVVPSVSLAQFNYTSAEFNYVDADLEVGPFGTDGDGFGVAGTFTVAETFFVGGSFEDFGDAGDRLEIEGGYFHSLDEDLDFVATLAILDTGTSVGNVTFDDDGIALGGGIRAQLTDEIEVDALVEYVDMDRGDSDMGIEVRGRYYLNDEFAIQAKAGFGTDVEIISIGVRGEF